MSNIKFKKTYYKYLVVPKKNGQLHPIATYCFAELVGESYVLVSLAKCHPEDKFEKRIGRDVALGRLTKYVNSNFNKNYKNKVYIVRKDSIPNILDHIESKKG